MQRETEAEDRAAEDGGAEGREARGYPKDEEEEEVVLQEYHSEDESSQEPRSVIIAMYILNNIISIYIFLIFNIETTIFLYHRH